MVPFQAYQELVQELITLKRDGFRTPEQVGEPPKPVELPQAIQRAILELGVAPQTERHLVSQAWEMIGVGTDETEIIARIAQGEDVPS